MHIALRSCEQKIDLLLVRAAQLLYCDQVAFSPLTIRILYLFFESSSMVHSREEGYVNNEASNETNFNPGKYR